MAYPRKSLCAASLILGAFLPATGWCQPPAFIAKWYCSRAMGMALSEDGTLYVASYDSHHIYMFAEGGGSLGHWGSYGPDPWSLTGPAGLALDRRDRIFVAELTISSPPGQTGLQVFTTEGGYIANWGAFGLGPAPGELQSPFGVAVGPDSCLYVSDSGIRRVQVFSMDGTFLRLWPTPGYTYGIAINTSGDVYLADADGNRIRRFTSAGTLVSEWGSAGSGPGQLNLPHNVAVDPAGNVYVADTYNHRIQVFTGDGAYLTEWGRLGQGDGQFYRPMGVLVDGDGIVYVADTWNGRVQKFGPAPTPTSRSSWGGVKARYR